MLSEDAARLRADGARRQNVFVFLDREDLAADEAGHADPVQQRKNNEQREHIAADAREHRALDRLSERLVQHDRKQNDHQKVRQRIDDIAYTHHDQVDLAACVARNRAVQNADDHNEDTRKEADEKRHAGAVDHAHEIIAAEAVRAEDVREAGLPRLLHPLLLGFRILERAEV